MVLPYQIMTVTGIGAFLLLAPILALISIIYAARQDNRLCLSVNLLSVLLYVLWIVGGFLVVKVPWLPVWLDFPMLGIWSAMVAIPHLFVWVSGRREKNRLRTLAGIFGVSSVLAATVGILFTCYGAT